MWQGSENDSRLPRSENGFWTNFLRQGLEISKPCTHFLRKEVGPSDWAGLSRLRPFLGHRTIPSEPRQGSAHCLRLRTSAAPRKTSCGKSAVAHCGTRPNAGKSLIEPRK